MRSKSSDLAANLARILEAMERSSTRAGRAANEITLVAVSKMHSAAQIRELYEAGVRHFGENRVQELESKLPLLKDLQVTWHMIGHLQGNKVRRAVRLFHSIDTVDAAGLAGRLNRAQDEFNEESVEKAPKIDRPATHLHQQRPRVLIEVKLDLNPHKSGVSEAGLPSLVESILKCPTLELRGLMGVPPYFDDPEESRPYFRSLRELRDTVRAQLGREVLPVLSMGMSHDFEVAIQEGATEIRIGTALFGERQKTG